jgi:hypothetical protein
MPPRRRPRKLRAAAALCTMLSLAGAPVAVARPPVNRPGPLHGSSASAGADTGSTELGTWLETGGIAAVMLAAYGLVRSAGRQGRAASPRGTRATAGRGSRGRTAGSFDPSGGDGSGVVTARGRGSGAVEERRRGTESRA